MTAPDIAVLRGSPDAAEVAALVTALALLGGGHDRERGPSPRRSAWAVPGARPGTGGRAAGRRWAGAVHPGGPA